MATNTITVTLTDDCGDDVDHELPARFEVCPRCEGHGTHLNPSIGEHVYSAEEFYESFPEPEDRAEYFKRGGIYDVTCQECRGHRVVPVVDEARLDEAQKKVHAEWLKQEEDRRKFEAECRAERMMEARMLGEC